MQGSSEGRRSRSACSIIATAAKFLHFGVQTHTKLFAVNDSPGASVIALSKRGPNTPLFSYVYGASTTGRTITCSRRPSPSLRNEQELTSDADVSFAAKTASPVVSFSVRVHDGTPVRSYEKTHGWPSCESPVGIFTAPIERPL